MEVLKTLSQGKVQQSWAEQMMTTSLSVAPTNSWRTLAACTCFPLMRKRRMRRRRRRRRSSPCDSKAISGRGAFACTSSRGNAGGARRARSRPRTTSSTRTCRDSGDAPVIMQPEFQQSCWPRSSSTTMTCSWLVLFVAMQIMLFSLWFSAGPGRAHRRQRQWYGSRFFPRAVFHLWLAVLIVDYGSGMARWFCLALCSL